MERIKKFLLKLSQGERRKVEEIISKIIKGDLAGLDVKKLRGHVDVFRARTGKVRVIFRYDGKTSNILEAGRRNDKTYKDY